MEGFSHRFILDVFVIQDAFKVGKCIVLGLYVDFFSLSIFQDVLEVVIGFFMFQNSLDVDAFILKK